MGNSRWGLGIHLIFISILSVSILTDNCLGARNLTTTCYKQERLALVNFKNSVKDYHGMLSSWVGNNCCQWESVTCDDDTGTVVSLHLRSKVSEPFYGLDDELLGEDYYLSSNTINEFAEKYQLAGDKINSGLAELKHLKYLDLSGNDFLGSRIPEFLGSFKKLSYLNLSNAGFIGNIPPHIGNLSNLKVLDLSRSDQVRVDNMAWVSGLSSLKHLNLNGVDLSRAQNLDKLLYIIPSLLKLRLAGCGLSNAQLGPHLNSTTKFANLKHLDLSGNNIEGQFPAFLQNMTSLVFLDLSASSNLSLVLNSANLITMFPSLSELRLSICKIQNVDLSPTHLNFSTRSNIQHLDLSKNQIEGRFPSVLSNMSSLLSLDLSSNDLNSSILVMPNLLKLDLSYNKFKHVGIWRQCHLKELIVSYNDLNEELVGSSTNVSECSLYALQRLNLHGNYLKGSISETFGRLSNLRDLDLSLNELKGPIPEALGRLRLLQVLDLSRNRLIGPIPKFSGNLETLYLSHNQLSGSIPDSLGMLTNLTNLLLQSNKLTGPIPISLKRLILLQVFSVSSNLLNGTIPVSIGQLTKLSLLDVSNNSLQGAVSEAHFANLSALKFLNTAYNNKLTFNVSREWIPPFQLRTAKLGSCNISDKFPQWFRTQHKLEELFLSNASISGPLPSWLRHLPFIRVLDLSQNELTGTLTNLPHGNGYGYGDGGIVLVQDNLFRGSIPRLLCTRTDLEILDLSRNKLTGKIPKCLGNLLFLKMMLLSSNRLSGVIPSSLGRISFGLNWLQLNDNNFSGEIPLEFKNFGYLVVLDLGENNISGNIPEGIGENLTSLRVLRLHKNNFTGRIPQSLCKLQDLHIIDLAHNSLTGSIPHCFGDLDSMINASYHRYEPTTSVYVDENGRQVSEGIDLEDGGDVMQAIKGVDLKYAKTLKLVITMDLSSNKLVGEIPKELSALSALVGLNLSNNHLSGPIPKGIGNMTSLFSLDFSANELTGPIPPSISALNFLSHLNLSHNSLSGRIPTGNQLQTLTDPSIYAGNIDLCGAPLPKNCYEDPTSNNRYEDANKPKKVWFYLDIMSGFATGFWGIIGVLMFKKQWRHKLFMFSEATIDKIHVAMAVRISKMKRGRIGA